MGLFSSFQRKRDPRRQQRAAVPQDSASAELLRVRARRRLIGAAVLVVLAVIALPMVFESQPRPLDASIAIVLPRKDVVAAPQAPTPVPTPVSVLVPVPVPVQPAASVQLLPQTPSHPVPAESSLPRTSGLTPSAPAVNPAKDRIAAEKAARDRAERVDRLAAEKAAAERAAAVAKAAADKAQAAKTESSVRFVIQVGAFAEVATVREARQRIEKLGLRATEQNVETANGRRTRVRLGPFNTREEAERTLARLRAAGLPGAVLTL
jgi:DedD protein